jgi:hypothetical protein
VAIGGLLVCGLLAGAAGVPIAIGDPGSGGVGQDSGSQNSEGSSTVGRDVNSGESDGNVGGHVNADVDNRGTESKRAPASNEDKGGQDSGDPKVRKNADPTTPKSHEPDVLEKPEPVGADKPGPVVPEKREPIVPEKPEPVVPEKPQPVVSEKPQSVVPEKREPIVPEKREPIVPEKPEPVVSEKPQPVVSEEREPIAPEKREPIVPEKPEPNVPEKPEPTIPAPPEPSGPGEPGPAAAGEASFWTWLIQLLTGFGGAGGGSSGSGGSDRDSPPRTVADLSAPEQLPWFPSRAAALLVIVGAIGHLPDDAVTEPEAGGAGSPTVPLAQFITPSSDAVRESSDAVTEWVTPTAAEEPIATTVAPPAVSSPQSERPSVAGLNQTSPGPASVTIPSANGRLPDDFRIGYAAYLRSASMSEIASIAMLGMIGLVTLAAAGGVIGYRQAKVGLAVRAAGTARFLQ